MLFARVVTPQIERLVASIPKPVGSFGYDPWGYNENTAKVGEENGTVHWEESSGEWWRC